MSTDRAVLDLDGPHQDPGSAGRPLLMLSGLSAGTFGDCRARPPLRSGSVVLVLSGTLVAQRSVAGARVAADLLGHWPEANQEAERADLDVRRS